MCILSTECLRTLESLLLVLVCTLPIQHLERITVSEQFYRERITFQTVDSIQNIINKQTYICT